MKKFGELEKPKNDYCHYCETMVEDFYEHIKTCEAKKIQDEQFWGDENNELPF